MVFDELTVLGILALACYGVWNFKRNARKAADAANNLSPETKEKAKSIGLGLLKRFLK